MFRKGFASFVAAAAATAVLWVGSASAQIHTASLDSSVPALAAASSENRIALVIGNSAYTNNKPLNNPANDAQAVSRLLNTASFEVVMAFDLTRDVMKQTVQEFAARINEKGPNTVALVYYAGHGMQVDGENYLVPVDAKLDTGTDLVENGVKLADLMGALEAVPSKMRIVILDACRNNPFAASGDAGGKGLAIVDAPSGSIVAYSTAPGTEALDGLGRHSPYAAAFMRTMKQPNMPIEQVFKRVRLLVHESTDSKQTPWESSSLTSDFVFFTNGTNDAVPAPAFAPIKVAVADLGSRPVREAYEVVVAEDSVEYYEEFVRLYPADPLCDRIRRLLSRRQQMIAWHHVKHQRGEGRFGVGIKIGHLGNNRPNGHRVTPFPNGNTGINGTGRPNASNTGNRVVPFPNGNTGINGTGRPNANRPGQVANVPQNGNLGINPNAGRPIINRPQTGNLGINPSAGRPIINRPQIGNQGLNRPVVQGRPSFQPRVAGGGSRFANGAEGRFGRR